MSMPWDGLAPFVAFVIALVGMQAAVVLAGGIRKRDFASPRVGDRLRDEVRSAREYLLAHR
jgi:hypothetical protein